MMNFPISHRIARTLLIGLSAGPSFAAAAEGPAALEGRGFRLSLDPAVSGFRLEDTRSGVTWTAGPFQARIRGDGLRRLEGLVGKTEKLPDGRPALILEGKEVSFALALDGGMTSVEVSWSAPEEGAVEEVKLLSLHLAPPAGGKESFLIVPSREGLLIPSGSGPAFRHAFGTSEYEGCHLNMIGLIHGDGAALVSWDDACITPEASRIVDGERRELVLDVDGRKTGRSILFTPLAKGDLSEVALAYRALAARKGLRVTLAQKMAGRPALERLIGAVNFKLWTCLDRRMSEDSKTEESVEVRWTFDQAAEVAEHLKKDLGIERCLFTLGGWIHRGYDCQHPDILPAAPECGGDEALRSALARIRALGYVDCLHDNYQDIYRDSPSFGEGLVMKRRDGSLAAGGKWLGGRAYLVCAPKSLELARRPQNLPEVKRLFEPLSYFIDTTYAVGPQECFDPAHPLSRGDDIRWKIALSDYSRELFGIFGSECGREWAVPHSDFFEGLVGVGGKYYHNLDPAALGALSIPFFEMVYHDCELAWGKYGFDPDRADEYVLHHVACARPLHHHGIPKGLYWKSPEGDPPAKGTFTRADGGWAEGLCLTDRFLKNTHEVLGPLHRETADRVLERLEFLSPDRAVRRMVWGGGETTVTCNFGDAEARVKSALGGVVSLPRWGFVVESSRFAAFHAAAWGGTAYAGGALFTFSSLDGKPLERSARVRAFHGFGPGPAVLRGKKEELRREAVWEFNEEEIRKSEGGSRK